MNSFGVLKVSGSALQAQRRRMNVIASNLANAQSTRTEEGGPYKRQEVVFATTPFEPDPFSLKGVNVVDVISDGKPPKPIYDPGHPDSNAEGIVMMPNINPMEEMVNMMMALRAYEASVSTFNTAKSMMLKSLEIGRS
ncbi:MAG: flagellar basal body rod protein FlgC [Syntrophorhabdaceae bacterium]|nr:flagellar basal body rod protein FlgC [Syntrophorhabdaceae bacterium]